MISKTNVHPPIEGPRPLGGVASHPLTTPRMDHPSNSSCSRRRGVLRDTLCQPDHPACRVQFAFDRRLPRLHVALPSIVDADLNGSRDRIRAQPTYGTCAVDAHTGRAKRGGGRLDCIMAGANDFIRDARQRLDWTDRRWTVAGAERLEVGREVERPSGPCGPGDTDGSGCRSGRHCRRCGGAGSIVVHR